MVINKTVVVKYAVIFLIVMLFFTVISNKIDYMMTPEVQVVTKSKSNIFYTINAAGQVWDGYIVFDINIEKQRFVDIGMQIKADFANKGDALQATVEKEEFNADYQAMRYFCKINKADGEVYEGQQCEITFNYVVGYFDNVIPRECVFVEGSDYYTYVAEPSETIFGIKYTVRKQPVSIEAEDDFRVSVSSGITDRDALIKSSSKPIANGKKVRVTE